MDSTGLTLATCAYDLANGAKCPSTNLVARGYCDRHYRTLKRRGAFDDSLTPRSAPPNEIIAANVRSVKRARKKLLRLAPDFVDHLVKASKIASDTGDGKIAQWAILHTRTVEPIATSVASATSGVLQPVINIGVKVSGMQSKE